MQARSDLALGVLDYRIMDPDARRVECFRAETSCYEDRRAALTHERVGAKYEILF